MRVCRIITRMNVGGPAKQVEVLNELPVETLLIHGRLEDGETLYKTDGDQVRVQYLQRRIGPYTDYRAYREIVQILRDFKPDIIHTHTSKAGALGRLAARRLGIRCAHTYHGTVFKGYFSSWHSYLVRRLERILMGWTDCTIAVSGAVADEVEMVTGVRPKVVANGFDLGPFHKAASITKKQARRELWWPAHKYIPIFVGRLVPIKNLKYFIDWWSQEHYAWPVVIGSGPDEHLIPSSWWHENHMDTERLALAYRAADELHICSLNEGTPTTMIEATVADCPVRSRELVGGMVDVAPLTRNEILNTYGANRLRGDILKLYWEVLND